MASSTAKLELIKKEIKQATTPKVIEDNRLQDLMIKIKDQPEFSFSDFSSVTKVSEPTIHKWASGSVDLPHPNSIASLARYLRVSEEDLKRYFAAKMSLDELWELRNSEVSTSDRATSILTAFAHLEPEKQLALMSKLTEIANKSILRKLEEVRSEVPEPEYLELSEKSQKRLKELLRISLMYIGKTQRDMIKADVNGALLESLEEQDGNKFAKSEYIKLLPFLRCPMQWTPEGLPVVDPNSTFGEDIDALLRELES